MHTPESKYGPENKYLTVTNPEISYVLINGGFYGILAGVIFLSFFSFWPTQDDMLVLKQMFKQLDPDIMKAAGDAHGRVQLAIRYRRDEEQLIVRLIRAHKLAVMDVRKNSSDPYVTFLLLPDHHEQGEMLKLYPERFLC